MIVYDAKQLSEKIVNEVKEEIESNAYNIRVVIIQANDDIASDLYINNKLKICEKAGIEASHYKFSGTVTTDRIVSLIKFINSCKQTTAILVQLPLFKHLNEKEILGAIDSAKDIDTLTKSNLGALYEGDMSFLPLTPRGVLEILKDNNIDISGKHAVIIGRSIIAGKSAAIGLLSEDATVTICHSRTKNLRGICKQADILVTCIGKQIIDSSYIKDGAVVINVGYAKNEEGKTVGDIFLDDIVDNSKASLVTKVFNCSGLMTTTMLVKRALELYKNNNK